jgi:hypothetical protein
VTCEATLRDVRRLARSLAPDLEGQRRLLERMSQSEAAEALRDALTEEGARRLLEDLGARS